MSISIILVAYLFGICTTLLGFLLHAIWSLRATEPKLPRMTVAKYKAMRLDIRAALARGRRP